MKSAAHEAKIPLYKYHTFGKKIYIS